MQLAEYFENVESIGILSTADKTGKVNAALYGRPHFFEDGSIAFITAEKLTHANLQVNPHAVYLFKEDGSYQGKRLYLTKICEEKNNPLIDEIRRKKFKKTENQYKSGPKYLIYFKLDKIIPLMGAGD